MYRILIVEDDFALAEAIRRQLESWGNEALCVQDFQNNKDTFYKKVRTATVPDEQARLRSGTDIGRTNPNEHEG